VSFNYRSLVGTSRGTQPLCVLTQRGWNSLMNEIRPSWRPELVGAEGQLGSMAAGNTLMVPPVAYRWQVQTPVDLHKGNSVPKRAGSAASDFGLFALFATSPTDCCPRQVER
jgi:hypothetical protein